MIKESSNELSLLRSPSFTEPRPMEEDIDLDPLSSSNTKVAKISFLGVIFSDRTSIGSMGGGGINLLPLQYYSNQNTFIWLILLTSNFIHCFEKAFWIIYINEPSRP